MLRGVVTLTLFVILAYGTRVAYSSVQYYSVYYTGINFLLPSRRATSSALHKQVPP